jgi:hypothetical protein
MPNNVLKVLSGGFRTAEAYLLDIDGYITGSTGTLDPITATGGFFISGVKTAAYKAIEPLVLTGTGEDQFQGHIDEPQQEAPAFDLTGSVSNLTLDGAAQTTNVVSMGNASVGVIQPTLPTYVDMAMIFWRLAISKDAATTGSSTYEGVVFPKVQLVPMGSDGMGEKKITDYKWHVICNPTTIWPTGDLLSALNFNTTSGPEFPVTSPHKLRWYGWVGDGNTKVFKVHKSVVTLAPALAHYTSVAGVHITSNLTVSSDATDWIWTFVSNVALGSRIVTQVEVL